MSKLKSAQYIRSRNKSRIIVPYDVQFLKKINQEDAEDLSSTVSDTESYVTPVEKRAWPAPEDSIDNTTDEKTYQMAKHETEFCRAIRQLWKERKMCDVILSVDNTVFRAHKVALAACSEHFRDLFVNREKMSASSEISRIPLLGIKCDVVRKIIEAVYNAKITLDSLSVGDILSAAAYLRMPLIVDACQSFLISNMCLENCIRCLQMAHLYHLDGLKEKAFETVCSNFEEVCKQKEFCKLRYFEVLSLIPRQDIAVGSEIDVFNAVVRWTEYDWITRLPYVGRLMRHVRFPLMTESQLVDYVEGCSIVSENAEVAELVREAVRYHLLPFRRSILQSSRTIPRTSYKMEAVIACGGLPAKEDGQSMSHIYYYDAQLNEWVPFAEMPEPRHHHAVAVMGGFLYIAGGSCGQKSSISSEKVWRYDPWMESWLQVADMLHARQSFQIGVLDSRLYAVGGRGDNDTSLSTVERYNPSTNAWSTVDGISSPRRHVALATNGGRLYAVGGSRNDLISRRVERYNPVSSEWERRHPLRRPRFSGSLHSVKNKLWLIGGGTVHEGDPSKGVIPAREIEVYSPSLDQWTTIGGLQNRYKKSIQEIPPGKEAESVNDGHEGIVRICRTEAGSCAINDDVFLVGGYNWSNKDRLNDVETIKLSNIGSKQIDVGGTGSKNSIATEKEQTKSVQNKPANYPVRCTGIACATLTLYKKPNYSFQPRSTALAPILNINQNMPTEQQTITFTKPKLSLEDEPDFQASRPRTVGNMPMNDYSNKAVSRRRAKIEKGIDTLRSIGLREFDIQENLPPRTAWIPRRREENELPESKLVLTDFEDETSEDFPRGAPAADGDAGVTEDNIITREPLKEDTEVQWKVLHSTDETSRSVFMTE